jgi:hypothetical protein
VIYFYIYIIEIDYKNKNMVYVIFTKLKKISKLVYPYTLLLISSLNSASLILIQTISKLNRIATLTQL